MLSYIKHKTWDYVLTEDYTISVEKMNFGLWNAYTKDGQLLIKAWGNVLEIKKGYAWDGCTGVPSYDWNIEASLVHDVLYQVKKNPNGYLCTSSWWQVDTLFLVMMRIDGASLIQRWTYYLGVRVFGFFAKYEKFNNLIITP